MTRKYDNSFREERAKFRRLKIFSESLGKPERPAGRKRSERRYDSRERALPADRKCPGCGLVKLESRRWVRKRGMREAICLKCFRLQKTGGDS